MVLCDGDGGFFERFGAVPTDGQGRNLTDWFRDITGRARVVVRPKTTAEVAAVVRRCADRKLRMVPQGGHTGRVGGATPSADGSEVVISLERLDRVREVDAGDFTMIVEAGCVLAKVHEAAAAADRLFPLQLGAQGSFQVGGNVATNAGGLNVVPYGMLRDPVLGLEAVLPGGEVWSGPRKLRKNNAGYDLKQLFIGSVGMLGIVTAACLKLFPKPNQVETAFLAVDSPAAAVALLGRARRDLSEFLSAFELLPREGVELGLTVALTARGPLGSPSRFYVLMEVAASGLVDLRSLVERFLEDVVADGLVPDGALASNAAQAAASWAIREGLSRRRPSGAAISAPTWRSRSRASHRSSIPPLPPSTRQRRTASRSPTATSATANSTSTSSRQSRSAMRNGSPCCTGARRSSSRKLTREADRSAPSTGSVDEPGTHPPMTTAGVAP